MMEAEQIARKLTKAQREFILAANETVMEDMALPAYIGGKRITIRTIQAVERAGLTYGGSYPPRMWLSPLGLAVRAAIERKPHDH